MARDLDAPLSPLAWELLVTAARAADGDGIDVRLDVDVSVGASAPEACAARELTGSGLGTLHGRRFTVNDTGRARAVRGLATEVFASTVSLDAAPQAGDPMSDAETTRSDLDVLRAILVLYQEAATDTLGAFYRAPSEALARRFAPLDKTAEMLRKAWAMSVPEMTAAERVEFQVLEYSDANRPIAAWLFLVADDVCARLAGDMDRPLPVPPLDAANNAEELVRPLRARRSPPVRGVGPLVAPDPKSLEQVRSVLRGTTLTAGEIVRHARVSWNVVDLCLLALRHRGELETIPSTINEGGDRFESFRLRRAEIGESQAEL